jgi:four helix bundle protein
MTYQRFEDLPVWRQAISLAEAVYALTGDAAFRRQPGLRDQLERAAVSVSNNIAEGFERGTTAELLSFLYIARGSAGEVRSMLCLLERLPAFGHLRFQISNLKSVAEGCSRQLRAWAASLQDSPIEGPRRLTSASRREYADKRRAQAFVEKLKALPKTSFPNPPPPPSTSAPPAPSGI